MITRLRDSRLFVGIARCVLAASFLWAAITKLSDPAAFARDITNYHLLAEPMVPYAAAVLPSIELVLALAVLSGHMARAGALLLGLLLVGFSGAMVQARLRGIDLECGCFGSGSGEVVGWTNFARNGGLVLAAVAVMLAADRAARWPRSAIPARDRGENPPALPPA